MTYIITFFCQRWVGCGVENCECDYRRLTPGHRVSTNQDGDTEAQAIALTSARFEAQGYVVGALLKTRLCLKSRTMKYIGLFIAAMSCALLLGACAPSYINRIRVPNTPEGSACMRECLHTHNECMFTACSGLRGLQHITCTDDCDDQQETCWNTCPGAYTQVEKE